MRCSPRPSLSRSPCSSCLVPGTWIGAHRIRLPIRRTAGPTATRSITKLLTANFGGLCPGAPTAREIRAVWPACGGAADVPRRDCVGVTSEPAAHTGEYTLSGAVASLTDTLDVFKGYHGRCAFGFRHDPSRVAGPWVSGDRPFGGVPPRWCCLGYNASQGRRSAAHVVPRWPIGKRAGGGVDKAES